MNKANSLKTMPLILLFCILISACGPTSQLNIQNNYTENDIFNDHLFGTPIKVLSLDEIFYLTEQQKQEFLKAFHSFSYRDLSYSQRIYKFLRSKMDNFNFHSDTLIASDAMAQNSGNCMSLAILTKALAKLTNTGISYELARTPPVYQREGDYQLSSQHIRSVVYTKNSKTTKQFIRPNQKIRIDYFSSAGSRALRWVDKYEFYSMYYSNVAAEALIKNNFNLAYWNLKEALNIKPKNQIAINMMGVLFYKMGHDDLAEKAYLYGLAAGKESLELLNNYHKLLVKANRTEEANQIAQELENYDDPDPFKWIDLADKELQENNYRMAIKLYEKAIEKADYLHQPYAGLAKAYYMTGRTNQAIKAIKLALENSHTRHTTSIYQAKYDRMKSKLN